MIYPTHNYNILPNLPYNRMWWAISQPYSVILRPIFILVYFSTDVIKNQQKKRQEKKWQHHHHQQQQKQIPKGGVSLTSTFNLKPKLRAQAGQELR